MDSDYQCRQWSNRYFSYTLTSGSLTAVASAWMPVHTLVIYGEFKNKTLSGISIISVRQGADFAGNNLAGADISVFSGATISNVYTDLVDIRSGGTAINCSCYEILVDSGGSASGGSCENLFMWGG